MNLSDLDPVALSQALNDHDPDREHWIDLERGSLWTFVFSESTDETRKRHEELRADSDGNRWARVPSMSTQEAYEEIEDFVEAVDDSAAQSSLFEAIEKKGALRNFREILMQLPEARAQWMTFRKERSGRRLDSFLGALGIERPASVDGGVA